MIKRPKVLSTKELEFIKAADKTEFDPDSPNRYKRISIDFNEYEHTLVKQAAKNSKRSITGFIKHAMINDAKFVLKQS